MKDLKELRKLESGKLQAELADAQKKHFEIRFNVESGQAHNTADIKKYKKYIAQIKTLMAEKKGEPKEEKTLEKTA